MYTLKVQALVPWGRHVREISNSFVFRKLVLGKKAIIIPFKIRGQPPETVKKWKRCGWKTDYEISQNLAKKDDLGNTIDLCTVLCVKTHFFHHEGAFLQKNVLQEKFPGNLAVTFWYVMHQGLQIYNFVFTNASHWGVRNQLFLISAEEYVKVTLLAKIFGKKCGPLESTMWTFQKHSTI